MLQETPPKEMEPNLKLKIFTTSIVLTLMAQTVKNLPAMQEAWVLSLRQEDPLEKEMATHYSVLAWKIPWTDEPGRYRPWGCKELDTTN